MRTWPKTVFSSFESERVELLSLQGNKMGRPSHIRVRLELRDGQATHIEVGGGVVAVLRGELSLP